MSVLGRVVAALLLFWAFDRHAYDYYVLLRWVVCGVAGYTAYLASQQRKDRWAWTLGIMAVFFNPVIPVHLKRDTWQAIDALAALLLLVSIAGVRERPEGKAAG